MDQHLSSRWIIRNARKIAGKNWASNFSLKNIFLKISYLHLLLNSTYFHIRNTIQCFILKQKITIKSELYNRKKKKKEKSLSNRNSIIICIYIYTSIIRSRDENFSNRVRKSFPREIGAAFQLLKITEIKLSSFEMYDRRGVRETRHLLRLNIVERSKSRDAIGDRRRNDAPGELLLRIPSIGRLGARERARTTYTNPYFLPLLILFIVFSFVSLPRSFTRSLPTTLYLLQSFQVYDREIKFFKGFPQFILIISSRRQSDLGQGHFFPFVPLSRVARPSRFKHLAR